MHCWQKWSTKHRPTRAVSRPSSAAISKFVGFVLQQELQDACFVKPILNGNDVKGLFKLDKSGAFIKTALDGVARWQFDNRDGARDEAIEWLRTPKEVFGLPMSWKRVVDVWRWFNRKVTGTAVTAPRFR